MDPPPPCNNSQDVEVRKGPWTMEEDLILINYIANHGEGVWNSLAKAAGLKRTGKSCRLRWLNYLRPDVKRGNITPEEQLLIMELHAKWGNRWSKIAKHLPGRTDNEIKNYWRTRIQKHIKQGESYSGGSQGNSEVSNNDQQASSSSQMSGITYNTMETYSPSSYQANPNNNTNNAPNIININHHNNINNNGDQGNFHHNHHHQQPQPMPAPFPPEMMATATENYWSMDDLWLLNGD